MHRIRFPGRPTVLLTILTLMLSLLAGTAVPTAAQAPTPGADETAALPEQRAAITLDLPAGEAMWRVTDLQSTSETDAAMALEPGVVYYALDDPLLVLFDDGTPLERLPADTALTFESPIQGHPVAMMAEQPVPFVSITVGPPDGTTDPLSTPFPVEAGQYELSLWLIDTAAAVSDAVSQRLADQTQPLLVIVRSGEADLPAAPGEEPRRLAAGDRAVMEPGTQLQGVDGAPAPVFLIGTLDRPETEAPQPGAAGAPSGPAPMPGGQQPVVTATSTATATATATETATATQTATATETAIATSTATEDDSTEDGNTDNPADTTLPSGSGSTDVATELNRDLPIFAPQQSEKTCPACEPLPPESGSATGNTSVEMQTNRDLPIFAAGAPQAATSQSAADAVVRQPQQLSCHTFAEDADKDRLSDACEKEYGTGIDKSDSDGDGLSDGEEVLDHDSDPTKFDTDSDGLTDGDEVLIHGSSPINPDSDGDGLDDLAELHTHRTNPTQADTDGDGLDDGYELGVPGLKALIPDTDGDTLLDGDEVYVYGTDPKVADMDEDGLTDGEEILTYGTDPFNPDPDRDCLPDGEEIAFGTSPYLFDGDGDGYNDYNEVREGTNPNDPNSHPSEFAGEQLVLQC